MDDGYTNNMPHFSHEGHESFAHSDIQAPPSLLPKLMHRLKDAQQGVQSYNDIASLLVALDDKDDAVRAMAIRELAQWHGNISDIPLDRLLAALSDPSWLVREAAILTLDALDIEVSQEHQMMALLDENEFVREAARLVFARDDSRYEISRATARVAPTIRRSHRSRVSHLLHSIDSFFLALYLTNRKGLLMAGQYPPDNSNMNYLEQITLQQRKRRRTTLGIAGAIVAVLVIAGIAFSWFTVLQKMPHNAMGHAGNAFDMPILSDTNQAQYPQLRWIDNTHVSLNDSLNSPELFIWNVQTKAAQQEEIFRTLPPTQQQTIIPSSSWSPDGRYVVNASGVSDTPATLTASPSSYTVTVEVWNVLANQKILTTSYDEKVASIKGPFDPSNAPYAPSTPISPDNTRLAIGQSNGDVSIWSLSTGKQIASYHIDSSSISFVQWSADSQRILAQSSSGLVQLWDTTTGKKLSSFVPPLTQQITYTSSGQKRSNVPTTPFLSPDGKFMVAGVGTNTNTIDVWDATTTKLLYTYKQSADTALNADWLSDSKKLLITGISNAALHSTASGGIDNIQVWNPATNQTILNITLPSLGAQSQQTQFAVSPSHRYIAVEGSSLKDMTIWDTSTGQRVTALHNPVTIGQENKYGDITAWSSDERFVAVLSSDLVSKSSNNIIRIWNVMTGKLVAQYHSHSNQVLQVVWSPNGKYLASMSDGDLGNVMEVWRAPS